MRGETTRVENRGETTRGKRPGENVLGAKRLVSVIPGQDSRFKKFYLKSAF